MLSTRTLHFAITRIKPSSLRCTSARYWNRPRLKGATITVTPRLIVRQSSTLYPSAPSATGFDNYEEEYNKYLNIEVPEYFNFAEDVLGKWSALELSGERGVDDCPPAFWWIDDAGNELKWSFTQLLQEANKV